MEIGCNYKRYINITFKRNFKKKRQRITSMSILICKYVGYSYKSEKFDNKNKYK